MNVLLIGSGGREHALAWKLAGSPRLTKLYCAPGNPGIADVAACVAIDVLEIDALVSFAQNNKIDLVVVGPEAPLVKGLADRLRAKNIRVFGASEKAARLEGSKGFMKDLCRKYNIPTAAYGRFSDAGAAENFIRTQKIPLVIKADGLAAGKGVVIAQSLDEALETARDMLSGNPFGDAGAEVVIEEFLDGEELSYFALSDGKTMLPLSSAQDHKRAYDGDQGPNTGGMGAYSPAHMMNDALERKILDKLIKPTIDAMAAEGCPFSGVLFAGVMMVKGEPVLLEYNVRFGDPECQALMMRLEGDLLEILLSVAEERLAEFANRVKWSEDVSLCVVMAAKGYPGAYKKNTPIKGLAAAAQTLDTTVFHAGTSRDENGHLIATGGRVLGVTSRAADIKQAQENAYQAIDRIDWPEGFCRRDIGWRAF